LALKFDKSATIQRSKSKKNQITYSKSENPAKRESTAVSVCLWVLIIVGGILAMADSVKLSALVLIWS
jgi:hypothetical protein